MRIRASILTYIFAAYPLFGFFTVSVLDMDADYVMTFICFVLTIQLAYTAYASRQPLRFPAYLVAMLVFAVYSYFDSGLVATTLDRKGWLKGLYANLYVASFLALLIVENTVFSVQLIKRTLKILYLIICFATAVSLIQLMYDRTFFWPELNPKDYYRMMEGVYKNKITSIYMWTETNSLGFGFVPFLSVLFAIRMMRKRPTWDLIGMGGFVSVFILSRWVMLNYLVTISQKILISKKVLLNGMRYLVSLLVLVAVIVLSASALGFDINIIKERILDKGANTRLLAVEMFIEHFPKHPFFGTGGVNLEDLKQDLAGRSSHIHVGWLSLFYYWGLIGGLIYLTFISLLVYRLWQVARQSGYWGSFFVFVGFVLANASFSHANVFQHGLIIALIFHRFFEDLTHVYSHELVIPEKRQMIDVEAELSSA